MAIYENMHELIGNTPMVKLSTINKEITSEIFAKLEFYNPAGSVKDRVGKYMIADAEEKKRDPGSWNGSWGSRF